MGISWVPLCWAQNKHLTSASCVCVSQLNSALVDKVYVKRNISTQPAYSKPYNGLPGGEFCRFDEQAHARRCVFGKGDVTINEGAYTTLAGIVWAKSTLRRQMLGGLRYVTSPNEWHAKKCAQKQAMFYVTIYVSQFTMLFHMVQRMATVFGAFWHNSSVYFAQCMICVCFNTEYACISMFYDVKSMFRFKDMFNVDCYDISKNLHIFQWFPTRRIKRNSCVSHSLWVRIQIRDFQFVRRPKLHDLSFGDYMSKTHIFERKQLSLANFIKRRRVSATKLIRYCVAFSSPSSLTIVWNHWFRFQIQMHTAMERLTCVSGIEFLF